MKKTYSARPAEINHNWYLVDASGATLGRLASLIATYLQGKHKPSYTPHLDDGDNVVVINAGQIKVTGKGEVVVNQHTLKEYFNNQALEALVQQPLVLVGQRDKMTVTIKVSGGGKRGQADAAKLAISRALNVMSQDLRPSLKKAGMLT